MNIFVYFQVTVILVAVYIAKGNGRTEFVDLQDLQFIVDAKENVQLESDEHRRVKRADVSQIRHLYYEERVNPYSQAEKDAILAKHREYRSNTRPEASNMEYMYWDEELAYTAGLWASVCYWGHGKTNATTNYTDTGQNLWLGGGKPTGVNAVIAWHDNEINNYIYDEAKCKEGKVCGHYTQVMWAKSTRVGCARAYCAKTINSTGFPDRRTNVWIFACHYTPGGNYVGTKPFKSGPSCTGCLSGSGLCYSNACASSEVCSSQTCECRHTCHNCGNLTDDCLCNCMDGWIGDQCTEVCEDKDDRCGRSPGWPGPAYCGAHSAIPKKCPLMCSVCKPAGNETCVTTTAPNFITLPVTTTYSQSASTATTLSQVTTTAPHITTIPVTSTTYSQSVSTATILSQAPSTSTTDPETTEDISTTPSDSTIYDQSVSNATTDDQIVTNATTHGHDVTDTTTPFSETCDGTVCRNGGTLKTRFCKCICPREYAGLYCTKLKSQLRNGVELLLLADIETYSSHELPLRESVAAVISRYCNKNDKNARRCCDGYLPNRSFQEKGTIHHYINYTDVLTAIGYPEPETTRVEAFWTMLLVVVPAQSDLCDGATANKNRRKRGIDRMYDRVKRTEEEAEVFLDQKLLLTVIRDNIEEIAADIGVPIDETRRGNDGTIKSLASTELQSGGVAGIVIVVLIIIFIIVVVVVVLVKKSTLNSENNILSDKPRCVYRFPEHDESQRHNNTRYSVRKASMGIDLERKPSQEYKEMQLELNPTNNGKQNGDKDADDHS